jgi:hypothetical protein
MDEIVLAVERDVVTVLRDLGLPTVIGALLGAVVTHFAARARGREEQARADERMVLQDERRAAQNALDGARDLRNRVNAGDAGGSYGLLHNDWQDHVFAPTRLIRDKEIDSRVRSLGLVIFHSAIATEGEHVTYAIVRAASDVEEALEAWLRREPFPLRHVPPMDEIRELVIRENRIVFGPLNEYLAQAPHARDD